MTDADLDAFARKPQPMDSQPHAVAVLIGELARLIEKKEGTQVLIDKSHRQVETHLKTIADAEAKAADVRRVLNSLLE